RKWDESSFFQAAERVLEPNALVAVTELLQFSKRHEASIGWGTGKTKGSFSPRFKDFAQKSVFSVYSDGTLTFNFGWLRDDDATEQRRDRLVAALRGRAKISIADDYRDTYLYIGINDWCPKVSAIVAVLDDVVGIGDSPA